MAAILHWKSFRILLEPHLYRLLRGHNILYSSAIYNRTWGPCYLSARKTRTPSRTKVSMTTGKALKRIFYEDSDYSITSTTKSASAESLSIDTSWWVATPCQDLHDGCWLTMCSPGLWQALFFILQGVKPPSSPAKNWWGSPFSHPLPDQVAGCTGLHVVAEQLWSDLTWLLYQLLLSKHKLSSLFSIHFLKERVERITLMHCKRPKHFPLSIILIIPFTFSSDYVFILLGENWCW